MIAVLCVLLFALFDANDANLTPLTNRVLNQRKRTQLPKQQAASVDIRLARRSIAEITNGTVDSIVCYPASPWNGLTLVTAPGAESERTRKLLELYFDRPLYVRSFFARKCSGNNADYLLYHVESPVVSGNAWFYGKSNVHRTVQNLCSVKESIDRRSCICRTAARTAMHAIESLENYGVESQNRPMLVLDSERLHDVAYLSEFLINFLNRFSLYIGGEKSDVDVQRISNVVEFLAKSRTGSSEVEKFQIDIGSRCFLEQWLVYKTPEQAKALFPEILFDSATALAPTPRVQSKLNPDVNVLIPTKDPKNLEFCLESLLNKADLTFGQVFFHFGVDHGDNKTIGAIEKSCRTLRVYCVTHEVYSRGGDVSSIVNHMFMSIDHPSYFFRYNDDSEMLSKNWNSMAINALRQPPTDVGIAKIIDFSNPGLQTHSFVSSVHKQIFGYYFPVHFKNIYEDNWITEVYNGVLTKTCFVKLKHHAQGSRYNALHIPSDVLAPIVKQGKIKISRFIG